MRAAMEFQGDANDSRSQECMLNLWLKVNLVLVDLARD